MTAEEILKQLRKANPRYKDMSPINQAQEKLSHGPQWQAHLDDEHDKHLQRLWIKSGFKGSFHDWLMEQ